MDKEIALCSCCGVIAEYSFLLLIILIMNLVFIHKSEKDNDVIITAWSAGSKFGNHQLQPWRLRWLWMWLW